jgi:hypothetical protein
MSVQTDDGARMRKFIIKNIKIINIALDVVKNTKIQKYF